jgi:hypothetical protein
MKQRIAVISTALVILTAMTWYVLSDVENRFGGGQVRPTGYVNEAVGIELDFVEPMAYAGSNVGEGDYLFQILGTEWFRMHFFPRFADGMDLQLRIRDASEESREFSVLRTLADYRRQGLDFDPSNELNEVIRNSGTKAGFSVFRRKELVMRDIAESITYLLVKRHGDALVQVFITRYSPDQAEQLELFLSALRIFDPSRDEAFLAESTPPIGGERIALPANHLDDETFRRYLDDKGLTELRRYDEYLQLYGLRIGDLHSPGDVGFLADYNASELRRLGQLFPEAIGEE